jgi:hypothetical protein
MFREIGNNLSEKKMFTPVKTQTMHNYSLVRSFETPEKKINNSKLYHTEKKRTIGESSFSHFTHRW